MVARRGVNARLGVACSGVGAGAGSVAAAVAGGSGGESALVAALLGLLATYEGWLAGSPFVTKSATCGILFTLSDILAQKLGGQSSRASGSGRIKESALRTLRYFTFGAFINAPMFIAYYHLQDMAVVKSPLLLPTPHLPPHFAALSTLPLTRSSLV